MPDSRLADQLAFVLELDKLKAVLRQNRITAADRRENDAEHSWHLAGMAIVLAEYAPPGTDLARVIKMLLLHDVVEIDAGDTFCYDPAAVAGQADREQLAADRLFGLLPPDQAADLRALWTEFEARQTPEARFAAALDRFQPVLLNFQTQGQSWRQRGVTRAQVLERTRPIEAGAPKLWEHVRQLLDDAVTRGYLSA